MSGARGRRPRCAEAPGTTALMTLFFGWEAASGGTPWWARTVFALVALGCAADLLRFAVRRARARGSVRV
ncbi:hypothetical protein [Streptomyces sp. NPDC059491]|uniref:hypothetical protein n=1 Tax=Streptomyces sp. NPDC059491 TaxID=3346850 RepID=UPI0036B4CBAD